VRADRIAELLQPFFASPTGGTVSTNSDHSEGASSPEEPAVLSPKQLHNISTYIDILLRWNARINLTAIRDPEKIVTRHFGESLFAARHLFPSPAHIGTAAPACAERSRKGCPTERSFAVRLADLGSGAGFPGIPIKLWAPHLALTLIESNHKKVAFLRELTRALTLTDINIFLGRAENLIQNQAEGHTADSAKRQPRSFHVVTLRAVERFRHILPVARRLLAPGGRLALLIGASQLELMSSLLPAFTWQQSLRLPGSASRSLLIGQTNMSHPAVPEP
jgi:16S rRNA (guanine527-N7)-methyltransferase